MCDCGSFVLPLLYAMPGSARIGKSEVRSFSEKEKERVEVGDEESELSSGE